MFPICSEGLSNCYTVYLELYAHQYVYQWQSWTIDVPICKSVIVIELTLFYNLQFYVWSEVFMLCFAILTFDKLVLNQINDFFSYLGLGLDQYRKYDPKVSEIFSFYFLQMTFIGN